MSIKNKALKGIFWSSIQQFGNQILTFIVSMILARLLMPSEFGLIAMLTVFIGISNALVNGGLTNSLIRSTNVTNIDYSTVFMFNIVSSIIIYILIYLIAPLIANFYNQSILINIIRVYSITIIINSFSTVQLTILTKRFQFKTLSIISFPSLTLGSGMGILFAYNSFGTWSIVYSAIIQSFVSSMLLFISSKWKPKLIFDYSKFKYHFNYGANLMISNILDVIFTNSYSIIIGKFFLPIQVGLFNRADALQMLPVGTISSVMTKVTFPLFSKIQDDNIRLKLTYRKIIQMAVFIITPILLFMAVTAEPLFRFLFTEKWLPAVPYFKILCFNGILYPIHSYNLQILNVKGRSDLFLKLEIIKKILLGLIIAFSFQYGIIGLLYGSVVTSVITLFINTYYSGKIIDYNLYEQIKDIFLIFVVSFLSSFALYFIDLHLMNNHVLDFFRLLNALIIGGAFYLIFSYCFRLAPLTEILKLIKKND